MHCGNTQGQKFGKIWRIHSPGDFSLIKLQKCKWIFVDILVYYTKLYGENPWILANLHWENPNGFLQNCPGRIQMDSRTWSQISEPDTSLSFYTNLPTYPPEWLVHLPH